MSQVFSVSYSHQPAELCGFGSLLGAAAATSNISSNDEHESGTYSDLLHRSLW